ncbi:MAG: hypothetical protein JWM90_1589 [Thermoleophilia bacterium]|nr:hypothetical protein [Thermoleophilia bacterium]
MRNEKKYAALGFVVAKFVLPLARKKAKQAAKKSAGNAVAGTTGAMKRHPARTSLIVGSALGAVGWLITRGRNGADDVVE